MGSIYRVGGIGVGRRDGDFDEVFGGRHQK